jgi:hypothetical protein
LPLGDLQDMASLAPAAAVSGGAARLSAIAERYGTRTAVVAHAVPTIGVAGVLASNITINLTWYDRAGSQTIVLEVPGRLNEDFADTIDRAIQEVTIELGQIWKRKTLVVSGSEVTLSVYVPISGLQDWIAMRERLAEVSMVQGFQLAAISRRNAQLVVRFLGEPARLALPLAQQGLELQQVDGYWQLGWREPVAVGGTGGGLSGAAVE